MHTVREGCGQYLLGVLYVCTGVPEHAQSPSKGHFSSAIPHDIHVDTNRVCAECVSVRFPQNMVSMIWCFLRNACSYSRLRQFVNINLLGETVPPCTIQCTGFPKLKQLIAGLQ